jgi:hypothetical protein
MIRKMEMGSIGGKMAVSIMACFRMTIGMGMGK